MNIYELGTEKFIGTGIQFTWQRFSLHSFPEIFHWVGTSHVICPNYQISRVLLLKCKRCAICSSTMCLLINTSFLQIGHHLVKKSVFMYQTLKLVDFLGKVDPSNTSGCFTISHQKLLLIECFQYQSHGYEITIKNNWNGVR